MCPDSGSMEMTAVRSWDEKMRAVFEAHTGIKISNWREIRKKEFEFTGVDGYQCDGTIVNTEHKPNQFLRVWSDNGFYVELKPEGSCEVHAPFQVWGIPGTFSLVQ
jgi:hypothetical protein